MKWSSEPPKEAGRYLVRRRGTSKARIMDVIANIDGWAWVADSGTTLKAHGWEPDKVHEWAGPIPEPEEPDELA